jgi:L-asparaginase
MNGVAVDAFVAAGARAIVSAGAGQGTVANTGIEPALVAARKKGVLVVRASRVGNGIVSRGEANRDEELGFVVADMLSAQKARILVMLALTRTRDLARIQKMFDEY